ncbi:hypothetical protein OT109_13250 [Phycisphaeraceae bacterium D3-23]
MSMFQKSAVPRLCFAAALAALWAAPGGAIVVNNNYFTASGGDTADVVGTLDAGYADAIAYSYADQFAAVGTIGQCTATWIGDSADGSLSYILTAAHCLPDDQTVNPIDSERFRDGLGNDYAEGAGTFYVPPERVNRPPGFGGASTDIGILVLPRLASILDAAGQPIAQPLLYDGSDELDHPVTFNGYGSWGIGTEGSSGSLQPTNGPRRAAGTNTIDRIIEEDHGLTAEFDAPGVGDHTPFESAVARRATAGRAGGSSTTGYGSSSARPTAGPARPTTTSPPPPESPPTPTGSDPSTPTHGTTPMKSIAPSPAISTRTALSARPTSTSSSPTGATPSPPARWPWASSTATAASTNATSTSSPSTGAKVSRRAACPSPVLVMLVVGWGLCRRRHRSNTARLSMGQ